MFSKPSGQTTVERILTKEEYIAPNIFIKEEILAKTKAYIQATDVEVAWLLLVEEDKEKNEYVIYDTVLLEQERSATKADMTEEGMQKCLQELIAQGRSNELTNIRGWGHSHVNMSVTPSGTDDSTFSEYYTKVPYFIRLIGNKKNEMRIDYVNREQEIKFDNVCWEIKYDGELEDIKTKYNQLLKQLIEWEDVLTTSFEEKYKIFQNNVKNEIEAHTVSSTKSYSKETYEYPTKYAIYSNGYENWKPKDYEIKIPKSIEVNDMTYEPHELEKYQDKDIKEGSLSNETEQTQIDEYLSYYEIEAIALCESVEEVKTEMEEYGLQYYYNWSDWNVLWKTAKEYLTDYYSDMAYGTAWA